MENSRAKQADEGEPAPSYRPATRAKTDQHGTGGVGNRELLDRG